ncbi:MAG: DUF4105 domain-containing protein [Bacteroidota bacterium]|nr:DUF4105 domain-containing protein [Bacteroidota bacterium]
MKKFALTLIMILSVISTYAYPVLSDSTVISLLTYAKTPEVYAMYGHTALRVKDEPNHVDLIFNYGTFDFNSPNFIYRFTKGDAEYILAVQDYRDVCIESYITRRSVREQILNLTQREKQKVFEALMTNAEPQNRAYKYNFLFDNCSTRPRLIVENNINGKLAYRDSIPTQTFRQLIHGCIDKNQWLTFGIDLILGSELDRKASYKEQMFLPPYLEDGFSRTVIIDSAGVERKLVSSDQEILPGETAKIETEPFLLSPNFIAGLLMVVVFALSFLGFHKNKLYNWLDAILFLIYGLTGCIVFFMTFVSIHPATNPNFVLFTLHPLHLIFAVACLIPALKRHLGYYHIANAAILAVFLLLVQFLPQTFSLAFLFMTFALFFRSLFRTLLFIKR